MSRQTGVRCHHLAPRILAGALIILYYTVCIPTRLTRAEEPMSLTITSIAFNDGGEIPTPYTCQGEDISPPLNWRGVPDKARSLVLIVDDPDAPDPKAPRMTWVHWVLFNLPPATTGLPEGITPDDLPPGTGQGMNSWNRTGYGGPCPPVGRHRYFHKLYALDTVLDLPDRPTSKTLEAAMQGHVIGHAEVVGTYQKSR
jgi:Raf kinase inhibitor-like YbhB/YbcL family protein